MLEKWKLSIDNKGFAGGALKYLNKTLVTINHSLLLARLHTYGFSKQALTIICSYLSKRKQEIKINNIFSSWKDLILGVSQGSILDLCFWFRECCETTVEKNSMLAIRWFENNYMKWNRDKCCLILSGYKHEQVWANIGKGLIW